MRIMIGMKIEKWSTGLSIDDEIVIDLK